MQRKYGIGEVLIFQKGDNEPERNESECVVDCYMDFKVNPATMEREDCPDGYGVQFADGALRFAHEHQLRRRPPKDMPSSWEAMKGLWTSNAVEA